MWKDVGCFLPFLAAPGTALPFSLLSSNQVALPQIELCSLSRALPWADGVWALRPLVLSCPCTHSVKLLDHILMLLCFHDQHAGNPWLPQCLALHRMPPWSLCLLPSLLRAFGIAPGINDLMVALKAQALGTWGPDPVLSEGTGVLPALPFLVWPFCFSLLGHQNPWQEIKMGVLVPDVIPDAFCSTYTLCWAFKFKRQLVLHAC